MSNNSFLTKKKYYNSKRNDTKSIMKGGTDTATTPVDKKNLPDEIDNENKLILYLNTKNSNSGITRKNIPKGATQTHLNKLMDCFEIKGQPEIYAQQNLNQYINALLNKQSSPTRIPFKVILDDSKEKFIPLIVQRVQEYRKLLVEIEKLKEKDEMINSIEGVNAEIKNGITKEKTHLQGIYTRLKIKRSNDINKDISHLYDFYIHKNLIPDTDKQKLLDIETNKIRAEPFKRASPYRFRQQSKKPGAVNKGAVNKGGQGVSNPIAKPGNPFSSMSFQPSFGKGPFTTAKKPAAQLKFDLGGVTTPHSFGAPSTVKKTK